ncbi:SMR family transporter [Actinomyces sp. B33]|uniref:DMT family transporter n=1 Tax=Actinomyces sp. B33 TaxID=2942131 RepID=UPI002340F528|nr:SMR family transporter [Actinomyces sp. B33]MDC4233849.1 SMR family transporter [Actinomyces sp. B33]
MAWVVLIGSGLFEAVWASALARLGEEFRVGTLLVFLLACTISMGGLMVAMRDIPVGTAYAAWAGTGAVATVGYSILSGAESASVLRIVLVAVLIGCIAGLHLIGE